MDKLKLAISSDNNEEVINDINKIIDEANKLNEVLPIPYGIPEVTNTFIDYYTDQVNNITNYSLSKYNNFSAFSKQYNKFLNSTFSNPEKIVILQNLNPFVVPSGKK